MSHSTGPIYEISSNVPTETVDDFSVVSQDDPNRPAFYVSGDLYTQLATTRETDFNFNVFDFFMPVGGGAPAHVHTFDDEVWYIAEGEVQYNLGNQGTDSIVVPEGGVVFGPVDKTHGFLNLDSTASISGITPGARAISTTMPGLLDLFFSAAGTEVADRNIPVPGSDQSTEEGFIDPESAFKLGARTNSIIGFVDLGLDDYQPPEEALDYVIVIPEDAEPEIVERAVELSELDDFSIWTTGNHPELPQRPTFTGAFEIEYTSLVDLEETENVFSYNQFSLESQDPETFDFFHQASLSGTQVVEPTESEATGVATVELNSQGEVDYSLTLSGLDLGEWTQAGIFQTPNNENDDVTAIHLHQGEPGINGPHAFNILDVNQQHENDLSITSNEDGSVTLSGTWNQSEQEIPTNLVNFLDKSSIPGTQSDFYFQIHTQENPDGEIRGQLATTVNADLFPEPVISENHQYFYVTEGQLSVKIEDQVEVANENTFVYVAPGNEYSIANFAEEAVKSLAVSIVDQEPPFPAGEDSFESPLKSQEGVFPDQVQFLNDRTNFGGRRLNYKSIGRRRIYGSRGNDELFAIQKDRLFGEEGNDFLDASRGNGKNRLYGGAGHDEILVNVEDRAFGNSGNDLIDASVGKVQSILKKSGYNFLDGGNGDDILIAGSKDQLVGGEGDDILYIRRGGDNLLAGGIGADRFMIANGQLPDASKVDYPEDINEFLPDGFAFPELVDTKNKIVDFELGVDKIQISGLENIASSFEDLELLPAFGDLGSTSIIATFSENSVEKEISLVDVSGVIFTELSAEDFIFT